MLFENRSFIARLTLSISLFIVLDACAQSSETTQPANPAPHGRAEGFSIEVLSYRWGSLSFKYPLSWHVEPQYYRTPADEEAAETPKSIVGFAVVPNGQTSRSNDGVYLGGRQADCRSFPSCPCFTVYETIYTCSENPETLKVFDLIVKTVRFDNPEAAFRVSFPTAKHFLHSGKHYTIHWQTKPSLQIRRVSIFVHDTSTSWKTGAILNAKKVPNTGSFVWVVPAVKSPGPYLLEISFLKPIKVEPPALGGARIYRGMSEPFYIY
jgi:hypothetical protein